MAPVTSSYTNYPSPPVLPAQPLWRRHWNCVSPIGFRPPSPPPLVAIALSPSQTAPPPSEPLLLARCSPGTESGLVRAQLAPEPVRRTPPSPLFGRPGSP